MKAKTWDKTQKLKQYGLTLEDHKQMWVAQMGHCTLCDKPVAYEDTHVDHNHTTGKIRGLLCMNCNCGLGMFHSDETGTRLLEKAIEYIRKYNDQPSA